MKPALSVVIATKNYGHYLGGALRSVYPRLFSPNGDGVNDVVVFQLNNPNNLAVGGSVYDLNATKVADLQDGPVPGLSLKWSGTESHGSVVPGGTYIYQISVGSDRVNGTVVVVK